MTRPNPRACAAATALATLLLGGCLREDIVQPVRAPVAVHAMAVVGSSTFGVALSRVTLIGLGQPVTGATIRLLRESATVPLVEVGESSSYCFSTTPDFDRGGGQPSAAQCYAANLNEPIGAGERLELEIELGDGTVIHGATTTPAQPEQITPPGNEAVEVTFHIDGFAGGGFSIEEAALDVSWHAVDDRPAEIALDLRRIFYGDTGMEPTDCGFLSPYYSSAPTRSPARINVPLFCHGDTPDPVWDSVDVDLLIYAYDASYVRYADAFLEDGTGVVLEHAASGIWPVAGDALVTGVFGSAAPTRHPLRLRSVVVDRRTASPAPTSRP